MCTLTYLPIQEDGYLLTSNRDEAPVRATAVVASHTTASGLELTFPQDPHSGGSWICVADDGRALCLLNGAFEKHQHRPPYRRSRGIVVLDFFEWNTAADFFEAYKLTGIEPFTMVAAEQGELHEFRWDGSQRYYTAVDQKKPHIWSSATLYTPYYRTMRSRLFEEWLVNHPAYTMADVIAFHHSGGTGDPDNDFIMNRQDRVRTVSISSIERKNTAFNFVHHDLLTDHVTQKHVTINATQSPLAKD